MHRSLYLAKTVQLHQTRIYGGRCMDHRCVPFRSSCREQAWLRPSSQHSVHVGWEALANELLREGGEKEEKAQDLSHSNSYKFLPEKAVTSLGFPINLVDTPLPATPWVEALSLYPITLSFPCPDIRPASYLKSLFIDYSPFFFILHRNLHWINLSYLVLVCLGCCNKRTKKQTGHLKPHLVTSHILVTGSVKWGGQHSEASVRIADAPSCPIPPCSALPQTRNSKVSLPQPTASDITSKSHPSFL